MNDYQEEYSDDEEYFNELETSLEYAKQTTELEYGLLMTTATEVAREQVYGAFGGPENLKRSEEYLAQQAERYLQSLLEQERFAVRLRQERFCGRRTS